MIDENLKIKEELADLRISYNQLSHQAENLQDDLHNEREKTQKLQEAEAILRKKIETLNSDFAKTLYKSNQMERENKKLKEEFYEKSLNTTQHSEMVINEYLNHY